MLQYMTEEIRKEILEMTGYDFTTAISTVFLTSIFDLFEVGAQRSKGYSSVFEVQVYQCFVLSISEVYRLMFTLAFLQVRGCYLVNEPVVPIIRRNVTAHK